MSRASTTPSAAELVETFSAAWHSATRHPFLDAVADGSLPASAFTTWLGQDYLFVADLLVFQARLLARAPRSAQSVLAAGLVGLESELGWFEANADRRGLVLDSDAAPTTLRYRALLEALDRAPYPVGITGLWAVERAYQDSWQSALPCSEAYREFVEHWTVAAFVDYVTGLEKAASLALGTASAAVHAEASAGFVEVAEMERAFWDMAWSQPSA
jgi:thiaminase